MQADTEVMHGGKGHCQHQRDGQCHHHAGAHTQRKEAHQQHDNQRFHQYLDELTDAGLHRRWLVGYFAQLHPGWQVSLDPLKLGIQRLAQDQNIAAILHRHGQANRILAHKAHTRRWRVIKAATHIRHIADAQGAFADANGEALYLFDRFEVTADAQLHALGRGFKEARRRHCVLLFKGFLHRCQRQAQGGELEIGQLNPDFFVLQPQQLDLADILDPLQLDLDAVGVVLEHCVVVTLPTQAVDIAESGTELIVEKRPLHIRRQGVADITDLFANLIPQLGDLVGMHRVAGHKGYLRFAGARERDNALVFTGFHQLLFDTLGNLARDFLRRGARPQGTNHHSFEGKGRVFALP